MLGLVGKANVGKSTFFSAATLAPAQIANYPFTTRSANYGVAYVRSECVCKELGVKDDPTNSICLDGIRLIPIKLIDCPGLVPGAWQGRGLGNQFLDEVRRADALLMVVDAAGSTDEEGRPCKPGERDPVDDVMFLERELDMWFLQILKRGWDRIAKRAEMVGEDLSRLLEERLSGLQIKRQHICQAMDRLGLGSKPPRLWSEDDLASFARELRLASKPMLIVANKVDMPQADENLPRLKKLGYPVVPCSAEAELALRRGAERGLIKYRPGDGDFEVLAPDKLTAAQANALRAIRERVLERYGSTGVQDALDYAYFKLLDMIAVFPVEDQEKLTDHRGRVLPDCYLVPRGTTAREFAGMIHSELAESFIYAIDVKRKMRVGEDYVLKHLDVIKIVAAKRRG